MGKSAAADLLARRGVPMIDTDVVARQLVEPGQPALGEVLATLGADLLDPEGRLNRQALAKRVFGDAAARRSLEAILHPRIRQTWRHQVDRWAAEGRALAVVVIPLLFEVGAEKEFDLTVCVACSEAVQLRRLLSRGWEHAEIQNRLAAQLPVRIKMERADRVVWNDGTFAVLAEQLRRIV